MFNRIVALICLLLLVAVLVPVPNAGAQRDGSGLQVPTDFNLTAAMKTLLGNYDPGTRTSAVTLDNAGATGPYAVRAFYLYEYNDSGSRYMLMATDAIPTNLNGFDCHACIPLVGAALLKMQSTAWNIELSEKPDFQIGGWGVPRDGDWAQSGRTSLVSDSSPI